MDLSCVYLDQEKGLQDTVGRGYECSDINLLDGSMTMWLLHVIIST